MKYALIVICLFCCVGMCPGQTTNPTPLTQMMNNADEEYSPNTIIISYNRTNANRKRLLRAIKKQGAEVIYDYHIINAMAIKIHTGTDINEAKSYFEKIKGVTMVSRDQIMHLHNTTNEIM